MNGSFKNKSALKDIKKRLDKDVDRFSNLETAQQSIIKQGCQWNVLQ